MIIHIDQDAFFCNCELLERPELRGKPVIIGHRGRRGVVSTCSYEARQFGVHSAMPSVTAEKRCPQAVWIEPRIRFYASISARIRDIFYRYTPHVEPVSLDEAYLDMQGTESLFGHTPEVARRIQREILIETQLTASVGVAPVPFIAKIASDFRKPNGFTVVMPDEVDAFLAPLPVGKVGGIGPATEAALAKYGIRTVGQLKAYPLDWLVRELGKATGYFLYERARGIDHRRIEVGETKSVSNERTFSVDVKDPVILRAFLLELTEEVAWRMRREELRGRTVTLKVRYPDFKTVSRSLTLPHATDITREIYDTANLLLGKLPPSPVRLIGVGVSGFGEQVDQADLFLEPNRQKQKKLDSVMDQIQEKYGTGALRRGMPPKADEE